MAATLLSCRKSAGFMAQLTLSPYYRTLTTRSDAPAPPSETTSSSHSPTTTTTTTTTTPPCTTTHFRITLRRSAIALGERKQGTLKSLGLHRRMQTVYHRHSSDIAGKILQIKELVEVENVPEALVLTKQEQRRERRGERGYKVVGEKRSTLMHLHV